MECSWLFPHAKRFALRHVPTKREARLPSHQDTPTAPAHSANRNVPRAWGSDGLPPTSRLQECCGGTISLSAQSRAHGSTSVDRVGPHDGRDDGQYWLALQTPARCPR